MFQFEKPDTSAKHQLNLCSGPAMCCCSQNINFLTRTYFAKTYFAWTSQAAGNSHRPKQTGQKSHCVPAPDWTICLMCKYPGTTNVHVLVLFDPMSHPHIKAPGPWMCVTSTQKTRVQAGTPAYLRSTWAEGPSWTHTSKYLTATEPSGAHTSPW